MRYAIFALGLALCVAKPVIPEATPRVAVTISTHAVGTDLWVVYILTASGAPDSLVATTMPGAVRRKYLGSAKDSVKYVRPLPTLTVSGSVAAFAVRRNLVSPTVTKLWSYTEPDVAPPTPTLDSIIIRPASATIDSFMFQAGTGVQLCAIAKWSDGTTSLDTIQAKIQICQDRLAAYRLGL
jgi:hypothetical protein